MVVTKPISLLWKSRYHYVIQQHSQLNIKAARGLYSHKTCKMLINSLCNVLGYYIPRCCFTSHKRTNTKTALFDLFSSMYIIIPSQTVQNAHWHPQHHTMMGQVKQECSYQTNHGRVLQNCCLKNKQTKEKQNKQTNEKQTKTGEWECICRNMSNIHRNRYPGLVWNSAQKSVYKLTWPLLTFVMAICMSVSNYRSHIYYFVWRKHENMSPCTGNRVNTNYERIASWGGCQGWTGDPRILETPHAPHCCSQRLNHSAMTHPSKRIGTSWAVSHWLQQRVDSGQERFPTGLLTPGTGV